MGQYTGGKWEVEPGPEDTVWVISDNDDSNLDESGAACVLAICQGGDKNANASLIAAAPELLEACKKFVGACEEGPLPRWVAGAAEKIQLAIAKAEGRS